MTDVAANSEKQKKPKQGRSPAYPSIDLKKALQKAADLHEAEGTYAVPMASAFAAWGYGAKSSGGRETRSAMRYFGLITLEGDGDKGKVKLSEKALRVLLDKREDETEKMRLIRELALTPVIHKTLLEQFPHGLKSDATVQHFLIFDQGFNQGAAAEVVTEFRATADYAGLYKPDNISDISEQKVNEADPDVQKELAKVGDFVQVEINGSLVYEKPRRVRAVQEHEGRMWVFVDGDEAGVLMEQVEVTEKATDAAATSGKLPRLPLPPSEGDEPEKPGVRKSRFALSEGDVVVTFPENLSADSVEDLDGFWQVFIKKARREAGTKQ